MAFCSPPDDHDGRSSVRRDKKKKARIPRRARPLHAITIEVKRATTRGMGLPEPHNSTANKIIEWLMLTCEVRRHIPEMIAEGVEDEVGEAGEVGEDSGGGGIEDEFGEDSGGGVIEDEIAEHREDIGGGGTEDEVAGDQEDNGGWRLEKEKNTLVHTGNPTARSIDTENANKQQLAEYEDFTLFDLEDLDDQGEYLDEMVLAVNDVSMDTFDDGNDEDDDDLPIGHMSKALAPLSPPAAEGKYKLCSRTRQPSLPRASPMLPWSVNSAANPVVIPQWT